jgi:glycosyltransferase involved in cell wall biosynthesis
VWIVDWSDSEQEDFVAACAAAGVQARVLRSRPLGPSVGTRLHRLRSWPAYLSLALRGLRAAAGSTPVVAWQPIAGSAAALLRRRHGPPLVILNPLLGVSARTFRQRLVLAGARRADRVLFFSSAALEAAAGLGLDRQRLRFAALGVRAAASWNPPRGGHLLAVGRDERDWATLATASELVDQEIQVVGPARLAQPGKLRIVPQTGRERLLALMADARAVVVPLAGAERAAGQLTVLDAMSVGRAVVATRTAGTQDYVTGETGILVDPGDAQALARALGRVSEPGAAEKLGRAAFEAARGPFSLGRFVARVEAEARSCR